MPTPPTPNFHPKAFIIGGRAIVTGGKSYGGDDVGYVMNQIKFMFDLEHAPAKIGKGGKLTRTQAIARAKQESDSYVLYMEIQETISTRAMHLVTTVDRIDYILLMPVTGEVVRQFKVEPSKVVQISEGGIRMPPRAQGQTSDLYEQLQRCGWDIARVLEYWL